MKTDAAEKEAQAKLKSLKALDLNNFDAVLWIIKRGLHDHAAAYAVAHVKLDDSLEKKLRNIVSSAITSATHLEPYDFVTGDHEEDTALTLEVADTDMQAIANEIAEGSDSEAIKTADELLGSWAYVIELKSNKRQILAMHKINQGWKVPQREKMLNAIFKNRTLMAFDDQEIFKLERKIDCFAYEGQLFILDKKKFETALNFRTGMEKNRDSVLEELAKLNICDGIDLIRTAVGTRLAHLRRISMIKKNGYYKQADFIEKLKKVCKDKKWNIEFDGSKIRVTAENVELLLKLLNNDRLASMVNEEIFDVQVKKPVAAS